MAVFCFCRQLTPEESFDWLQGHSKSPLQTFMGYDDMLLEGHLVVGNLDLPTYPTIRPHCIRMLSI